jgi:uncharacterized damage-inducible protein DinB
MVAVEQLKSLAIEGSGDQMIRTLFFAFLLMMNVAPAQSVASAQNPVGQVLDAFVSNAEREIVPAAEAMPEDKYAFAPSDGQFQGVRTFAQQVKHLAAANYQLGARILGEDPPHHEQNESAPDSVRSKREVLEYLRGSFTYLRSAVATIDEHNSVQPIAGIKGTWQRTRLGAAVDAIAHSYDHYGQMVEYLRMNGVIPPASR